METLETRENGTQRWNWSSIGMDLAAASNGKVSVYINPFSIQGSSCCGHRIGEAKRAPTKFTLTWYPHILTLLTMNKRDDELIEAFEKVFDAKHCQPMETPLGYTVGWGPRNV